MSEQHVTDHIRELGGSYYTGDRGGDPITMVMLGNTAANDSDLDVVLQLQFLKYLELSNTRVTDDSVERLFSHPTLRIIEIRGSEFSHDTLRTATRKYGDRITLAE